MPDQHNSSFKSKRFAGVPMGKKISMAGTNDEIAACYPVIAELRPQLSKENFISLVKHLQRTNNFRLAYLQDDNKINSVAGYRISEWLAGGKYLEIEDFVSSQKERSKGYGSILFDWLVQLAAENSCRHLRLVSHVRRVDAHRFYLSKGMVMEGHYFSMELPLAKVGDWVSYD